MGGERKAATSSLNQRVLTAVSFELTAAAQERWRLPVEGFLWRARRSVEAMLYALLVESKVDVTTLAEQGKGIDALVKHERLAGSIPREVRNHVESVQKYGNTAAHFQPDGSASEASAGIVASALGELARWFYTHDGAALPDGLTDVLAALASERGRLRTANELAFEREQRRADALAHQLQTTQADITRAAAPRATWGARHAAVGLGAALAVAAAGFAAGRWSAPDAAPPPPRVADVREPTPTPVATPTEVTVAVVDAGTTAADVATAGMDACPTTMRLVGGRGEPHAFCIDRDFVLEGDYRRCVESGRCEHPPPARENGCNWENRLDAFAANCLPWAMAQSYCRQRPGGGDLPTRQEWQLAAASRVGLRVIADTFEWSSDPAVGGMRPVRGARLGASFAWSAKPEARGHRGVSFRCVLRAPL